MIDPDREPRTGLAGIRSARPRAKAFPASAGSISRSTKRLGLGPALPVEHGEAPAPRDHDMIDLLGHCLLLLRDPPVDDHCEAIRPARRSSSSSSCSSLSLSSLLQAVRLLDGRRHGGVDQVQPDLDLAARSGRAAGRTGSCSGRRGAGAARDGTPGR